MASGIGDPPPASATHQGTGSISASGKMQLTLFGEAESTCEARIRVLEAHILDVQAQNLVLASNGSNVNSDSQHRSAMTLQTQTVDLHRLVNFMESMSSRSGSSSVPRDRNSASEETVMNYVATHFNNPIESATLGLDSQM
ncbi:hypothetical protein N7481_006745 [Penicillium waksmanii]|uniref:uncharacterized protein n=1 Tax=Penicillium waksmanii TaxID=69791 RepID=UPI002546E4EB|nr:uncharacterized protein N7481_006745 [Penicillium waksmanii]KAJ5984646.1 hypothetical protein N7481_006745 [Penicillium waksmanii]